MLNSKSFDFSDILMQTRLIKEALQQAFAQVDDEKVATLAKDVTEIRVSGSTSESPPLCIAFVGQYNAGKSTILRALTGRADIVIDSDVCTDTVTAYDWHGVRLLDTPGIHAGYPNHDEITHAAIDRADLLMFIITNELFDDTIGPHFRELAFQHNRAREMLLVVNKMGQDTGAPDIKCRDIEQVTTPLTCEDFSTVFIDAKTFLEADGVSDDEDRHDLLEIANFDALIDALNRFVADRGFTGRLTVPLFTLRAAAEQAIAMLSVDLPEEHATLELLHRKRGLLLTSRVRLQLAMSGLLSRAVGDIIGYGDEVAESIEPGKTKDDVEQVHQAAQRKASQRSATLYEQARECVETELDELHGQFEALRDSVLARELCGRVAPGGAVRRADLSSELTSSPGRDVRPPRDIADWPNQAKKIGDIASCIGNWAAKWATGPLAESARVGSLKAAFGSEAHLVVYDVGKFFGGKFQPWGAVKAARFIGNAGRAIAAVGGVLAIIAQISEDRQQEQYRRQLHNARNDIRTAYRDSTVVIQSAFWHQFGAFLSDFYNSELEAIDAASHDLVGQRNVRQEDSDLLRSIAERTSDLLLRVRSAIAVSSLALPECGT